MHINNIRKRLLTEKELTLEKAMTLAFSIETSSRELKSEPMNKLYNDKKPKCYRCNNPNHLADRCRYKHFVCRKCKLTGHLARACTSHPVFKPESKREIRCRHFTDSCTAEPEDELYFLNHIGGKHPYRVRLLVNHTEVEFEIDTGSGKTVISESLYFKSFQDVKLEPTSLVLKTYSGDVLDVLGKIVVNILHEGLAVDAELYSSLSNKRPRWNKQQN